MNRMQICFVAACLALAPLRPAAAEPAAGLPSEAETRGAGAGKVFVIPVSAAGPETVLDPKHFQVHASAPGSRAAWPFLEAGKWLALPAPELDLRLEGGGLISPYSVRVARPAAGAPGQLVRIPVGDAGRVTLDMAVESDELRTEVHFWSAGPYRDREGRLQGELARIVPFPLPEEGVAMPVGQVVAGVYEPQVDRYLLITPPFEVKKGELTKPEIEIEDTFAQFVLDLPFPAPSAEGAAVDLQQGGPMEPDLIVQSRHRVTAFWYSLFPGSRATLTASAGDYLLAPWEQMMRGAVILAERGPMAPWPELDLELRVPAAVSGRELELEARGPAYLTHEELEFTGDYRHTFRKLPVGEIELVLKTPLGTLKRQVDFSSGDSQDLLWEPELLALEGRVFYDEKPHRARVVFGPDAQFETDEDGRYRAELLGAVKFVQVRLEGVPGDPHVEILAEPLTASGTLDIRVPAVLFSVRVIDAASRQGIEDASVELESTYQHKAKDDGGAPGPLQQLRQSVNTDEAGKAWLPPVQPGILKLTAEADGYLASKPLLVEIPAKPEKQEFELTLDKVEGLVPLELKLASGAPAARSSVALYDPAGSFELWRSLADEAGKVEVPAAPGHLLVSGGEASFLAIGWPPQGETRQLTRLPAAGNFLMMRVTDRHGRPFDGARIALYLDGKVYRGDLLAFLFQAPSFTSQGGLLIANHVPPQSVGLLAYSPLLAGPPAGATPTIVPFPWPQMVELRLFE